MSAMKKLENLFQVSIEPYMVGVLLSKLKGSIEVVDTI